MHRYSKFSLLAGVVAAAGTVAYAATDRIENDGAAISRAKIALAQAISTAEQHVNGKAARAEYETSKAGWVFDVEVVTGAKVFDVKVDAEKGTVISSTEDKADRNDDHDKDD